MCDRYFTIGFFSSHGATTSVTLSNKIPFPIVLCCTCTHCEKSIPNAFETKFNAFVDVFLQFKREKNLFLAYSISLLDVSNVKF